MTSDRWEEINRIYDAAVLVAEKERASFLEKACEGDQELRREVESLLAYDQPAQQLLGRPAMQMAAEKLAGEPPSLIGRKLGPYQIQDVLGAGGMGEVYKAKDTRLNRMVAIKVLPRLLSERADLRQRFEREARAVASLNHPNICALYDIGRHDGIDFLVMEYLEGETLSNRLKKGPLPTEQLLRSAIEIATALDQAHRHGVIHRDLKPGNIMLTKAGAKLLDFGLAKHQALSPLATGTTGGQGTGDPGAGTETKSLTEEGMILGTLEYMAPEQVEGKEADTRTDIFALGVVIYEMATGRKAFEGTSKASLTAAILTSQPPDISSLQPLRPAALDRLVKRCLEKDPDERWQTARDLTSELKWIAEGHPETVLPGSAGARRTAKERLIWAVALGVVAIGGWWVGRAYISQTASEARVIRFTIPSPGKNAPSRPLISPDGQKLAIYDGASVWVRPLNSLEARKLTNAASADDFFWSPDSRFIAFWEVTDNKVTLSRIEASGGVPRIICDIRVTPESSGGFGTWSRDGTILFERGDKPKGLSRVSADGGVPEPVTTVDESRQETDHTSPRFLPDGRHFLFGVRSPKPGISGIWLGSLDSAETRHLVDFDRESYSNEQFAYAPPGYVLYKRLGRLMAHPFDARSLRFTGPPVLLEDQVNGPISVSDNGTLCYWNLTFEVGTAQVTKFDRRGKEIESIGPAGKYNDIDLSPDGSRLALEETRAGLESDIWVLDLRRAKKIRLTTGGPTDWNYCPRWSPDGTEILFTSNRDKNSGQSDSSQGNLYKKSSTGEGDETAFLKSRSYKILQDWSRDGRYITYATPESDFGLFALPLFGERKPFLFLQRAGHSRFSPDGQWIANTEPYPPFENGKPLENVKMNVYVRAFPSGDPKWKVSPNGGMAPRWRGDGKELYYWTEDRKLMAVEVKVGNGLQFASPKMLFEALSFDPESGSDRQKYAVRPDGQYFYMLVRKTQMADNNQIDVVLNWTAQLAGK